jgi:hypothetical protein
LNFLMDPRNLFANPTIGHEETQHFRCMEVPNPTHGSNASNTYPKTSHILMTMFSTSLKVGPRLSFAKDSSVTEQLRSC